MKLRHRGDGGVTTLATTVDIADGLISRGRGLMFRRSIPDDYALVFEFDGVTARSVHMLFVPFPIDVLWLIDGEVQRVRTLSAWTGTAKESADTFVELPAGAADGVAVGDTVEFVEE
ncbi:hypothetical protein SAMN06269185_1875 [Natronoarchaeum philippinense]|uniref:DUF192 domain-containing protein n=1 Tax=Natronoarchaeum philippinense TaxID=558529 RepID=A0A285NTB9_NATPI|nr:DUF192 domain-containing protein [Natronoarchaeum philippinense]SNZ12695.1 hypothetical protein SAMN06269185_1875 [Natronoarchaeum philippinense]